MSRLADEGDASRLAEDQPAERHTFKPGRLDRTVTLVQLLTIVIGGAWTLFAFLTYTRLSNYLDIQDKRQKLELSELQILSEKRKTDSYNQPPLGYESELVLETLPKELKTDTSNYMANLTVILTNRGEKPLEITFSVIEYFLGTMSHSKQAISLLNPPSPIFAKAIDGSIRWVRIGSEVHAYEPSMAAANTFLVPRGYTPAPGGGGTSLLRSGESSQMTYVYLVTGSPQNWVGFVVNIGTNGAVEKGSKWAFQKWSVLAEAKPTDNTTTVLRQAQK